ncbi:MULTISPECIES: hypothetical protein [unclassified Microcoleus]|uniref:hypothetical protein n=1 Tax=unclassified Microcoleus TaxID=2642155 RepID=UPI002FCE758C
MFIGFLLITTLSFSCRLLRAIDRPCLFVFGRQPDRPRYTLPSSRPWKYIAGVKNCYAESPTINDIILVADNKLALYKSCGMSASQRLPTRD